MPAPEVRTPTDPVERPAAELIPERIEPPTPVIAASAIGWSHAPDVDAAARKENGRALKLHRAGDYAGARDGFAAALRLSPDHDLARYNLACALARLGEIDAARDELSTLLHRDLLRFQGRWRGPEADADLEALRTSKHAPELDALVGSLRTAYAAAHDRGIPAYLYAFAPNGVRLTDDDQEILTGGTSELVAGAWLHDAKRFVPLARGEDVALLDLPRRRVLVADTLLELGHCEKALGFPTIAWLSTDPDPTKAVHASVRLDEKAVGVAATLDVLFPLLDFSMGWVGDHAALTAHWDDANGVGSHIHLTLASDGTLARVKEAHAFEGTWLHHIPEGARFHAALPAGYTMQRRALTVPGRADPIELDGLYDDLFAAPGPSSVALALYTRFDDESDGLDALNDTTIDRIELATGTTQRLVRGDGAAWVVVGPDGAVYADAGGQTQRWATPDATTPEPTMAGLHLTMPMDDPFCECCG